MKIKLLVILSGLILSLSGLKAQTLQKETSDNIGAFLTGYARKDLAIGRIKVDSSFIDSKRKEVKIYLNANASYIPFRDENVHDLYAELKTFLPLELRGNKLMVYSDNRLIEHYIPTRNKKERFVNKVSKPMIVNLTKPFTPTQGLLNKHIAVWQSHGYYYEQKLARWEWQRARVFQTVEDLYTQSYVLPYLVPMLENAGANVFTPRERDFQLNEVIVDNDGNKGKSIYRESGREWQKGQSKGFAHNKEYYIENENPFEDGTFRQIESVKKNNSSKSDAYVEWIPEIPKLGKYAVYVSYKSLPNSVDDALYTVYHKGGKTQFKVNQTMGGGTWLYLGHFMFDQGCSEQGRVTLSIKSEKAKRILTADAVKFGGGYGNIARKPNSDLQVTENKKSADDSDTLVSKVLPQIEYEYELSGYPRYTEAARYWLQWAGYPDSVYTLSGGKNDYTDDYQSRGKWVNYLSGGSSVSPKDNGLKIPIDLALAFHSDAGTTPNDSIIGTLGIYNSSPNGGKFPNGTTRMLSHDLTDLIQTQIVNDIRRVYEPNWSRRGKWDKPYSEARMPNVPTMLLELLSHQNLADMRYGLDPRFRFLVSRAIYKGMLRYLATQYNQAYVVQPLPVDHFSIEFVSSDEVLLKWKAVKDSLEESAFPTKYIVYTRIGEGDFDGGQIVADTQIILRQDIGVHYSYKITAVNDGGESFPSEILSAYRSPNENGVVMIINGFDRVSAPASFVSDGIGGFYDRLDHGVPDKQEVAYVGSQYEYRRNIPWMDDDAPGFGASDARYETTVIGGNTFDYPALHGRSIGRSNFSYVSCSNESVMDSDVDLSKYRLLDLILGKQKQTQIGRGVNDPEFKTFPKSLQDKLKVYCQNGGNIFVSGSYVATDLWDNGVSNKDDKSFATDVLKYTWRVGQASTDGRVRSVASSFPMFKGKYVFHHELNSESYIVESPDGIEPIGDGTYTILRYSENNISAGVAHSGQYKTCILGFPFESVKKEQERDELMQSILNFFTIE